MPRYTSKENPEVTIDVAEEDPLPGGESAWVVEGATPARRKRRADTGTVPVQGGN